MVKKKKIIAVPLAGLGNRMRVLASCIQIAKRDGRDLCIAWPINSALGCDITDIFETIGIDYTVPPRWMRFLLTQIYRPGAIKRFNRIYKVLSRLFSDNSIFDSDILDDNKLDQLKPIKVNPSDSSLLVASCLAFSTQNKNLNFNEYLKNEDNREFFKSFQFTSYLRNEVNREYQKIGESYIGIHIRRTDHVDIIKNSPNQNYVNQIDKCILEKPSQKFFLASDDEETKKYFTEKYQNRIYTLNHKLGREDLEGIYGGVIELLLLSKSSKIICSVLSSYSTTAILLGDIKEVQYI